MRWLTLLVLLVTGCVTRDACPPGEMATPAHTPAFALVRSDYGSSAVALLAADGTVVTGDWIDSGSRVPGLVTAVAGDLVVPSSSLGPGAVAWIGRYGVDVLTIVQGTSVREIDVRGEGLGAPRTGFSANPQDALLLDDGRILVSRLGINHDPAAPELQRGNDVVVVEGDHVTQRLPMPDGTLDDCTGACVAYARPAAMVRLQAGAADVVLVVLERSRIDFDALGPGAVVAIDARTLAVSAPLDLSPLENCQYASRDPDDTSRAYVSCASLQTQMPDERRPRAGVATVALDATGTLVMSAVVQTRAPDPVVNGAILGIGHGRVLVVATESSSDAPDRPDHLLALDVATGAVRDVYQSRAGFALWGAALAGDLALIPDHESGGIVRIDIGGDVALRDVITIDDCVGLPAFQIAPLDF